MIKAAYYTGKDTFSIGECVPVAPGPNEVQIAVAYCGICGTDLHIFHGAMDGRVKAPQVIGHEMSGTISAIGSGVNGWSIGDRVTVRPLASCGVCPACVAGHTHICQRLKFLGVDTTGAFQGRWTVPADTLHRLPESVSLERGALIEPLAVACHDVRIAAVQPGEYIVVQGGGPIGMLVALVARGAGGRVLISEVNPFRLALATSVGFETVNPREADLVARVESDTNGAGADVVFEVTGTQAGAESMTKLPRTRGRIVVVAIYGEPPKVDLHRFFWRELRLFGARVYEREDFERAISLVAADQLPLDRITSAVYPLEDLADGMRKLAGGGDVMKVLIRCE